MSPNPYSPMPDGPLHQNHYPPFPSPINNSPYPLSSLSTGQTPEDHHAHHEHLPYPDSNQNGHGAIQRNESSSAASIGITGKVRLRKACDSCSIRKVKCDEEGHPCRACKSLGIPCTYERKSRRRGPPNRHAEAFKKRRLDSPTTPGQSTPSSPTNAAHALASFAQHQVLSAESICPFPILQLLIDDYFTYIHPLIPIPHEPSFRDSLQRREDVGNPRFLALLASMIGSLVASFPRKPRLHLKAQNKENLFPNSLSLVERCHKISIEARGPGYLDKELTAYDAATSYLLGLTFAYTYKWPQAKLYFGESLMIARNIGIRRASDHSQTSLNNLSTLANTTANHQALNVDIITQEMGRRTFWVTFVGVKSIHQLGISYGEIFIPPATPSEPYPPLPMEVDDAYICSTHVLPQPPGLLSELVGFNANVRVYMTCDELSTMDFCYGPDELFDWERQKRIIERCLHAAKRVLKDIPPELQLCPSTQFGGVEHCQDFLTPALSYPDICDPGPYPKLENEENSAEKLMLKYEIQKANIYGSQLGTRSYIVEKYWNLCDTHKRSLSGHDPNTSSPSNISSGVHGYRPQSISHLDLTEQEMATERESIIKDLLIVLGMISPVNMEPNGGSFINKMRSIASTLLDVPWTRKGQLALRAEEHLAAIIEVLMKLERASPLGRDRGGELENEEDEEVELRGWADLREHQNRFARAGGFS